MVAYVLPLLSEISKQTVLFKYDSLEETDEGFL